MKKFHIPDPPEAAKFLLQLVAEVTRLTRQVPECPYDEGGALYWDYKRRWKIGDVLRDPVLDDRTVCVVAPGEPPYKRIYVCVAASASVDLWTIENGGDPIHGARVVADLIRNRVPKQKRGG